MENYAKKLAINQKLSKKCNIKTFPIKKINEDYKYIEKTYTLLGDGISKTVPIPPSGEWLLDNFYLIEEQVGIISREINKRQYKKLPSVDGTSRIYIVAEELIKYTDGVVNDDIIINFIRAYQTKKNIYMEELWLLPVMLKIALISYIKKICEKIVSGMEQKFKVESLIERIVENKNISEQKFNKYKNIIASSEATSYVEYLIYMLKKRGKDGKKYLNILEEEIRKVGTTSNEVIKIEHYDLALQKVSIANSITSMRNITRINWMQIFEEINDIDIILGEDEEYKNLDFETRNMYRGEIQKLSIKTKLSEIYIAINLIELSKEKNLHVGFFLIGDKEDELRKKLGLNKGRRKQSKLLWYLITIYLPSLIGAILIYKNQFLLAIIPFSEVFVMLTNRIISKSVKPKLLPALEKIDKDVGAFVIVPTLLNNKNRVIELIKNLEVYYLGNEIDNLHFALLGDASELGEEKADYDEEIIKTGIEETKKLNDKYGKEIFFFLYRRRVFNEGQGKWLGYERKRGMICEFNSFILYGKEGTFIANTIERDKIKFEEIKYIITLDADTELIIDSAKKLIGIMEHPLNKPVIENGIVTKGYGLIQPKVGISIDSSTKSIFSKIYAGDGGIDVYSTAESNVYQDVFGEAIFTGKGIYNLQVFDEVLKNQIPENLVLSHDLLEGSYVRCGLASNVEVVDGFPSRVNSYMLRMHRWTRGDWQIISWLTNHKINKLSRYKIFDNLRRSVLDIALLTLIFMRKIYSSIGSNFSSGFV